jgi:serine/threonine-protein kinase
MALEPAKLSDFAIAGALGSGSTARVYDAIHTATGRGVAIKTLEPSQQDAETRERFAREALFLAGIESRHIGKILGFGFERGQPFLVLERLHGETLDAKLRRDGPVPIAHALRWIEQLLVGIRDCHDANIIHRDIKPSNIFLHQDGEGEVVKVIDFGVARLKEVSGDQAGLTSSQALIGSMGYMAPEQFRDAKTVDFTADLYAIGVVVFRALTGRLPFVSRSLDAVIRMKLEQQVPTVSSMPGMPANPALDRFVRTAMERRPEDRFQSAREMRESWWTVIASLDRDAADPNGELGRVDESYEGPRAHAPPGGAGARRPELWSEDDERTVRRVAPPRPVPPPHAPDPASGSVPAASRTEKPPRPPFYDDPTLHEAPKTIRGVPQMPGTLAGDIDLPPEAFPTMPPAAPAAARPGGSDPPDPLWDVPTKTDSSLRQLVERELELQRRGKSGG